MVHSNATDPAAVNAAQPNSKEPVWIALTPIHAALINQIVEREAKRSGESPESVRRLVEIGILTRGIAAVQEDGS